MKRTKKSSMYLKYLGSFCNFFLDLIFPKFCVGCKREGDFFCSSCQEKVIVIKTPVCPTCSRITKNGQFCSRCSGKTHLTGVLIAAHYEGVLKEAIHSFKYDHIFSLKKELGELLIETLQKRWTKKAILIPVPLHIKKERERGYNQSFLLANEISKKLKLEVINKKLKRKKYTKPQITLTGANRKNNIKNAFTWNGKLEVEDKIVILVDDVYTTGSTLSECASVLRKAGAKEVWGLVLAKG